MERAGVMRGRRRVRSGVGRVRRCIIRNRGCVPMVVV